MTRRPSTRSSSDGAARAGETYTHASDDRNERVLGTFADFPLTLEAETDPEDGESPSGEGL